MTQEHTHLNISAALAASLVAIILIGVKLWALSETGALSVAASLADSGLDLIVSLAGLAAIVYAARPPDDDHGFGHGSAEDLAALGQALFLIIASGVIAVAAIRRLLSDAPVALEAQGAGMVAMGISIALTLALVLWQRRVVARTGNAVIAADSLHYLGDLVPNVGAILALYASARYGLTNIDSVVALGTSGFLAVGALGIGRGAWNALMDREADPEIVAGIAALARDWPGIDSFHDLRTRKSGQHVFVNIHVEIDGRLTLTEAHDIGAGLRRAILDAYPQADVIIHKDPVRDPLAPAAPAT